MKAIITGGNRGIGLETTKKLLAKGFEVHVLSRSGLDLQSAALTSWNVDVADYEQTIEIIDSIGVPNVFVNNAGMMNAKTATDYNHEEILHILNINLINAVRICVHLAEQMANKDGGRIISVGSIAGEIGHPDIWYGISKAGLVNAMRSLARTYGNRGVLANSVAPGPIETDMIKNIPTDRKNRLKAATINQRFGTAAEVAEVMCWLATDAPSYLNGEVIDLNNGMNYR